MKATELIKQLQEIVDKQGDSEVVISDKYLITEINSVCFVDSYFDDFYEKDVVQRIHLLEQE